MKILPLILAGAILAPPCCAGAEATAQTDARLAPLFNDVLLLHFDDVSIPMFFRPDGSVYFAYLHLKRAKLNDNYTRTVPWKLQGEQLCVVRSADEVPCWPLTLLKQGGIEDTLVQVFDANGKVTWSGKGQLMLIPGRPPTAALGGS